jgi:hypothetical protein
MWLCSEDISVQSCKNRAADLTKILGVKFKGLSRIHHIHQSNLLGAVGAGVCSATGVI